MENFLVRFGQSTRVVKVRADYKDLDEKIREVFTDLPERFILKYVDKDFPDTVIEVNTLDNLKDKLRNYLEVCLPPSPPSPPVVRKNDVFL